MWHKENPTSPTQKQPPPNHRTQQCKIPVASLPFQTNRGPCRNLTDRTEPTHCLHSLQSKQRRKDPLELLPVTLLPDTSTAVQGTLCSPKVISIFIPFLTTISIHSITTPCHVPRKQWFGELKKVFFLILKWYANCWIFHYVFGLGFRVLPSGSTIAL